MVLSLSLLLLLLPKILIAETLTMTTVIRFCLFPGNAKRPVERANKRYMCIAGLWVVARTSFSLLLLPFTRSVWPSATAGSVTSSRKGLLPACSGGRRSSSTEWERVGVLCATSSQAAAAATSQRRLISLLLAHVLISVAHPISGTHRRSSECLSSIVFHVRPSEGVLVPANSPKPLVNFTTRAATSKVSHSNFDFQQRHDHLLNSLSQTK